MTSPAVRRARIVYGLAAASNFLVTIPAFVAYNRYVDRFMKTRPNYPFLVWIWSGMAFLWGVSFVEIARDPEHSAALLKYSWMEKAVTSTSVITAFAIGDVTGGFLVAVIGTDVVWIPLFAWTHAGLAREWRAESERKADAQKS